MQKEFKDIKMAGLLMLHDDDEYAQEVLDDMNKYVNSGIFVNLNSATPFITGLAENYKKRGIIKEIIYTENKNRWNQGLQRENTMRMLDKITPDVFIFPDSDEILPKNLKEQLEVFWNNEEYKSFWFRLLYCWGDREHFRNDRGWKGVHHVRAGKWEPNLTYLPHYSGYAACVNHINLLKKTRYHSTSPIIHLGYIKEKDRQRKYLRQNCTLCDPTLRDKSENKKLILPLPDNLKIK